MGLIDDCFHSNPPNIVYVYSKVDADEPNFLSLDTKIIVEPCFFGRRKQDNFAFFIVVNPPAFFL